MFAAHAEQRESRRKSAKPDGNAGAEREAVYAGDGKMSHLLVLGRQQQKSVYRSNLQNASLGIFYISAFSGRAGHSE